MAEELKIAGAPPPPLPKMQFAAADAREDAAAPPALSPSAADGSSSNGVSNNRIVAAPVAVDRDAAPVGAAPSDPTRCSPTTTQEEELVAASDDSDAATDETGSASADDPPAAAAAAAEATVAAAAATDANDAPALDTPPPDAQRKRKRAKRLGFSGSKPKPKRNGVCAPPQPQDAQAAATQQTQSDGTQEAPDSPLFQDSAALYPSAPGEGGVAWDWSMSDVFYDPLGQESVDQLERVRRSCANIIAANVSACKGVQQETAQLAAMLRDASDATSARVRPLRRGRRYRDVWEEEDFLHSRRKRDGFLADKTRGFADQDALLSNHELVHGYDDDLFERYMSRLEAEWRRQQSVSSDDARTPAAGAGEKSGSDAADAPTRKAKAPPRSLATSVLPAIPPEQCHPAAWGSWILKNSTVEQTDVEAVHPASLSRAPLSSRWREEAVVLAQLESEQQQKSSKSSGDANTDEEELETAAERQQGGGGAALPVTMALWGNGKDDVARLPSYGSAVEEDEISHEIASSLARLIPLSMLNWRLAQTVYERAGVYAQCSPVIEQEERVSRRIEALYQRLYPPGDDGDDEQDERVQALRRVPVFRSLRADLVAHSLTFCRGSEEAQCVAASVEYALTLQVGDEVDVLDRNGCWNDGFVVDVFRERGQAAKYVLLRLSLWDASGSEWVSVTEGRILPRGVADGKTTFTIGPTRALELRTEFNRALADTLEKTLPVRHVEQNAAAAERKRAAATRGRAGDDAKQKKKVKRAL